MKMENTFAYIRDQYGVLPEYPFEDDNHTAVFRHAGNRKWFAVCMQIPRCKIGLDGTDVIPILNVKADPFLIGSFLQEAGFYRAYHMNKTHWITIALDGSADGEKARFLIDMSYSLTGIRRRGKKNDL